MEYQVRIEYKKQVIEVRAHGDESRLYIDGEHIKFFSTASVPLLSNKQLVCRIYEALLNEIRNTPKDHFKSLSFKKLVSALKYIVATDKMLRDLRRINSYSRELKEKVDEEVKSAVRSAINLDWNHCDKFSLPEKWALNIVSGGYTGSVIDTSAFEDIYNPVKDDCSKVSALLNEFKTYSFTDFMDRSAQEMILKSVQDSYDKVTKSITDFRIMRDIAGNDAVNWGPHKWASQAKKAGLKDTSYVAQRWLGIVAEHLIEQGVKPAEKKESSATQLKKKYADDTAELTQDELVKLFKAGTESQAAEYVRQMNLETAMSLLEMTTKNVTDKLYRTIFRGFCATRSDALGVIVSKVASGNHPAEFNTLISFLKSKKRNDTDLMNECTWELFLNHAGEFTHLDFAPWAINAGHSYPLPQGMNHLPREFFDKVLLPLVTPMHKYSLNYFITDAFLRYQSTDADKLQLLIDFRKGVDSGIRIDWELSAEHFQNLPYPAIKEFMNNPTNELKKVGGWEVFLDLIIQNKDTDTAQDILLQSDHGESPYVLFNLFNFTQKAVILEHTTRNYLDIEKVMSAKELREFGRIALTKENLSKYIPDLPVSTLNDHITVADVTTRVLDSQIHIPLTDKIVKNLSKDAALRLIKRAALGRGESSAPSYMANRDGNRYDYRLIALKRDLYSKLTRDEIIEATNTPIIQNPDFIAMVDHMTPDEIKQCCTSHNTFFRLYLDKVPADYIAQFKDKAKFKDVVGDRRQTQNDDFGKKLESRLNSLGKVS